MAAHNHHNTPKQTSNEFQHQESGYSSATPLQDGQQYVNMMSYAHHQQPMFQSINGIATTMAGDDCSIDTTLGPAAMESTIWDSYRGTNFTPAMGNDPSDMWALQAALSDPAGSHIRNGQPTPPLDMMSMEEEDSGMEGKTKSRKRLRTSNVEGKRKPRKSSKIDPEEDISHLSPEEIIQREKFLERNRVAASKCRQKKKEWTTSLEERARELQSQREMLVAYVSMLRNELLMLKCKCLQHSDCKCERLRDYLKNTVATLPPASADLYKLNQIEHHMNGESSMMPSFDDDSYGGRVASDSHSRSTSMASTNLDYLNLSSGVQPQSR